MMQGCPKLHGSGKCVDGSDCHYTFAEIPKVLKDHPLFLLVKEHQNKG
jgi:hypothetical protein